MNILDGLRFRRNQDEKLQAAAMLPTVAGIGAASVFMSIKAAIEGKEDLKTRRMLTTMVSDVRRAAVQLSTRKTESVRMGISESEISMLKKLGSVIKDGVGSVVKSTVGYLARALFMGIRYAIIPLTMAVTAAANIAFSLLLSPQFWVTAGVALAGWKAYSWYKERQASTTEKAGKAPLGMAPVSTATTTNAATIGAGAQASVLRNNPGNLRYQEQPGSVLESKADVGKKFATFVTQEEGLYNTARQLQLYDSRGKSTIDAMVRQYAPPNENRTQEYVDAVSKRMGVAATAKLDMSDPKVVESLVRNILIQESGHKLPYTDAQYADAARRSIDFRKNNFKDAVANLVLPVSGVFTSAFGMRDDPKTGKRADHHGIDIAAPVGTPVYAATSGTVLHAGARGDYGNLVELDSGEMVTRYGHLSKFDVRKGDKIIQGQKIGEIGSTGKSTGAHLHFETQPVNSIKPVDPARYVSGIPEKAKRQALTGTPGIANLSSVTNTDYVKLDGKLLRLEK